MNRNSLRVVHRFAGILGLLIIIGFWSSTVLVEAFGDATAIAAVKTVIAVCVLPLCLSLAAAGATGLRLAGRVELAAAATKRRRTKIIALTGLLLLVPCALYLAVLAQQGQFGTTFALVQGIELLAGAMNMRLLWLNIRDGARLREHRDGAIAIQAVE